MPSDSRSFWRWSATARSLPGGLVVSIRMSCWSSCTASVRVLAQSTSVASAVGVNRRKTKSRIERRINMALPRISLDGRARLFENTTNSSWWIIQTQPTRDGATSAIKSHQPELVDSFISSLRSQWHSMKSQQRAGSW
jgi:hypothetical protein